MAGVMRTLIVSDDGEVRQALLAALECSRRSVRSCDFAHAAFQIDKLAPDVLVVHVARGEHVSAITTASALACSMYVLAVIGADLPPRAAAAAIAAGAQDVLRMPYTSEELHLRVDARERLCRWIRAPHDKANSGVPAVRAWQYLDTVVADDLEGMLGRSVVLTENHLPAAMSPLRATIPMTLPAAQTDLCISITADDAGRRWLGSTLLGDPDASHEMTQDMLRELANLVGGAFKRAALGERVSVSTGIPIDSDRTPYGPNARSWEIVAEGGAIGLIADVRAKANRKVPARRLAEGMVVVQDVVNGAGVLLLPSGTRLTSTTAERLSRLLDQTLIDVCA